MGLLSNSPAHCAAAKGRIDELRLLKDKKGDLWLQNVKGEYPIHDAAPAKENSMCANKFDACVVMSLFLQPRLFGFCKTILKRKFSTLPTRIDGLACTLLLSRIIYNCAKYS
jgi:hypothetical protein